MLVVLFGLSGLGVFRYNPDMKRIFRFALFAVLPLALFVSAPAVLVSGATVAPAPVSAAGWREMLREYERLRDASPAVDLTKEFPGVSTEMARLGEAFARTASPADLAFGRKNFRTLVHNLGMENPGAGDLRQFLHPNKSPWPGYTGPTDGNFHILFNTGTLNLDPSDGSSKMHPVKKIARRHLGFFTTQSHVKALTQVLSATIRAEKADINVVPADAVKRAALLEAFKATWKARFPKQTLSGDDLRFAAALLPYVI